MKIRILLISAVLLFSGLTGLSAERQESVARNIAMRFMQENPTLKQRITKSQGTTLPNLDLAYSGAQNAFYVYNVGERLGYVIVSGDDCTRESVLGYADAGKFVYDSIPSNMRYWLEQYEREITYIQSNGLKARTSAVTLDSSVEPLLGSTAWNQSSPYNDQCPSVPYSVDSDGNITLGTAVTGCVATAMAQIMYYHKWPEKGTGSYSYTLSYSNLNWSKTISADFSQSEYDWDAMTPTYDSNSSEESKAAVAKLMSDVGVSVNMTYGSTSGAVTSKAVGALTTYFSYDTSVKWLERSYYSISTWEQTMRDELDAGRPILYSGRTGSNEGHAFVCDGYNTDGYFHINWGWGGLSNGYFLTTALTPSQQGVGGADSGFNFSQGMAIGIKPADDVDDEAKPVVSASKFYTETTSISLGSSFQVVYSQLANNSGQDLSFYIGYKLTDVNDNILAGGLVTGSKLSLNAGYYYTSGIGLSISLPTELEDGTYRIYAVCQIDDSDDIRNISIPFYEAQYITVTVTDGTATLSNVVESYELKVTNLTTGNAYAGQLFSVSATIANTGAAEYYGTVYFTLENEDETLVNSGETIIDLEKDDDTTLEFNMSAPDEAGTYKLCVYDADDNLVYSQDLIVEASTTPVLSLVSINVPSEMTPDNINATAVISNTGGTFSGNLQLMICSATGAILKLIDCFAVIDENASNVTINLSGTFHEGTIGESYILALRYPLDLSKYYTWGGVHSFTLTDVEVGIDSVTADDNTDVEYYNLQGVRVENPTKGVFIKKQGSKTTKVIL